MMIKHKTHTNKAHMITDLISQSNEGCYKGIPKGSC